MSVLGSIIKPPIPYVGGIPGVLNPGNQIIIQGSIPNNSEQFAFNLASGSAIGQSRSDTALHFNPRFTQNCVVRNSYKNNVWANEERLNGMPFTRNSCFEVIIYADLNCFKFSVNNKHFCDFQHRHPLNTVNTMTIEGQVSIDCIKFIGHQTTVSSGGFYPPPAQLPGISPPAYQLPNKGYPQPAGPILNPIMPLTTQIPSGLYHGKMIFISGTPNCATRFSINLQEGWAGDIGLHFDVRFNIGDSINVLVRNHCSNGAWGTEERMVPYFPFSPKTPFEMIILCENTGYKVAVNNQHLLEFRHRLTPFARFDTLRINGDVSINQVRFQ